MEDGSMIPLSLDIPNDANDCNEEEDEAADALKREKQIQENLQNAFDDLIDDNDDDDSQLSDRDSVSNSHHRYSGSYQHHKQSPIKKSFEHGIQPNESSNISDLSYLESNHLENQSLHSEKEDSHHSSISNSHSDSSNINSDPYVKSSSDLSARSKRIASQQRNYSEEHRTKIILNASSSAQFSDQPADLQEEYMKLQLLYDTRGRELEQMKIEEIQSRENTSHEIKSLKLRVIHIEDEKDRLTSAVQESQKLISEFRHENNVLKGKVSALEVQLSAERDAKVSALSKLESCEVTIQSLELQISSLSRSENAVRLHSQFEEVMKDWKLRHQKEVLQLKEEIDKLQEQLNDKGIESENATSKVSELQQKYEELLIEKSDIINKLSTNLESSQRQCQKLLESGTISDVSILKLQLQHVQEEKTKLEKQNLSLKDEVRSLERELHTYEALKNMNENGDAQKETQKIKSNQNESNLKQELQTLLKIIQTLRLQNKSLKEKLDELQHQLPVWEERAKLFESKFNDAEKKAKEIEKKLDDVLTAGSIPKVVHELNDPTKDLLDLQKKYHDLVEKFKTSVSHEKKLLEARMKLKSKISDMSQKHAVEKIALEEYNKKCLESHQSSIQKISDEFFDKANDYENRIAELQNEIKVLNKDLYDVKAQYVKVFEENIAFQARLDSVSQQKEYQDIETEIRNKYEKKLIELESKYQKQAQDGLKVSLKQEIEKVQEEWTKEKMIEVREFINNAKRELDEEFCKCLETEQDKFKSELASESEKLTLEHYKEIRKLKEQAKSEKENLNLKLQAEWKNKIRELKESHQLEIESIKLEYEAMKKDLDLPKLLNSLQVQFKSELTSKIRQLTLEYEENIKQLKEQSESEKENLKSKLKESFHAEWKNEIIELKKNHQLEIESIKQEYEKMRKELELPKEDSTKKSQGLVELEMLQTEYAIEKQAWMEDKDKLNSYINARVQELLTAIQREQLLREKVEKYKKYTETLKNKFQLKIDQLEIQMNELKNINACKETEILDLNKHHQQDVMKLQENQRKHPIMLNIEIQTDEPVISKQSFVNAQNMFIQCLQKISEEIKNYLVNARKRTAKQLQQILYQYHERLTSKIVQDTFKEPSTFIPSICIPHLNINSQTSNNTQDNQKSPNTLQQQFNAKLSELTLADPFASGDASSRLNSYQNGETAKNTHNTKAFCDSAVRFEDISFEFIQMPDYTKLGGLFNHEIGKNFCPERVSPLAGVK